MIAAIVVIMLFFTWVTDGAYLSAHILQPAAPDGHHRHPRRRHGVCDYFGRNRPLRRWARWSGCWAAPRRSLTSGSVGRCRSPRLRRWVMGALLGAELMVGGLSQGPLVYRHPRRDAGVSRHSDRHHLNGTTVSPTSPAMAQIGQSYLPDGIGFGIGVVGMAVRPIIWQWRGRMRRQALGLATASSTAAVGRQPLPR